MSDKSKKRAPIPKETPEKGADPGRLPTVDEKRSADPGRLKTTEQFEEQRNERFEG